MTTFPVIIDAHWRASFKRNKGETNAVSDQIRDLCVRAGVLAKPATPGLDAMMAGRRHLTGQKCDWREAEDRAIKIRQMRREGMTVGRIGADLHLDHTTVCYYLSQNCKAYHRAVQNGKATA